MQPVEDRLVKQTHCTHMAVLSGAISVPHHNVLVRSLQFGGEFACLSLEHKVVLSLKNQSGRLDLVHVLQ